MLTVVTALLVSILQAGPTDYVHFTLRNESTRSIPLIIPDVMNPNLSPMSNSGVNLKVGQEIYFFPKGQKKRGHKELLLIVDESLQDKVLKVNELIRIRKRELEE